MAMPWETIKQLPMATSWGNDKTTTNGNALGKQAKLLIAPQIFKRAISQSEWTLELPISVHYFSIVILTSTTTI